MEGASCHGRDGRGPAVRLVCRRGLISFAVVEHEHAADRGASHVPRGTFTNSFAIGVLSWPLPLAGSERRRRSRFLPASGRTAIALFPWAWSRLLPSFAVIRSEGDAGRPNAIIPPIGRKDLAALVFISEKSPVGR